MILCFKFWSHTPWFICWSNTPAFHLFLYCFQHALIEAEVFIIYIVAICIKMKMKNLLYNLAWTVNYSRESLVFITYDPIWRIVKDKNNKNNKINTVSVLATLPS